MNLIENIIFTPIISKRILGYPTIVKDATILKNTIKYNNLDGSLHLCNKKKYITLQSIFMTKPTNLTRTYFIFNDFFKMDSFYKNISPLAIRSLSVENAGGKSEISEMFSMNHYISKFGAAKILMEMEIEYWIKYKMVDYICAIPNSNGSVNVGVSVTRAMGYPFPENFDYDKAINLINKKIDGLVISRRSVTEKYSFQHAVLHVWCQTNLISNLVTKAFYDLELQKTFLEGEGIVILHTTVCDSNFLYNNNLPPQINYIFN